MTWKLYRPAPKNVTPMVLHVSDMGPVANPHSDVCAFVQDEQRWAAARGLRSWPRAFHSRDGWIEWSIDDGVCGAW